MKLKVKGEHMNKGPELLTNGELLIGHTHVDFVGLDVVFGDGL